MPIHIPSAPEVAALDPADRAALAAAYLAGIETDDRGRLPLEVFAALAGRMSLSTVEVALLRRNSETGAAEILLLQRPDNDAWWVGQWHLPGTVIRDKDEVPYDDDIDFDDPGFEPIDSYRGPVERLMDNELKGGVVLADGPYLYGARFRRGVRGPESTVMLYAGVEVTDPDGALPVGRFFNVQELLANPPDEGLIVGHAFAVARAAARYAIHNS
jgi:hypothetical protein